MKRTKKNNTARKTSIENNVIDKYYNEDYNNEILEENPEESLEFESNLHVMKDKLEFTEDNLDLSVNILENIVKAEEIILRKKERSEIFYFLISSVLLFGLITITSIINPNFIKVYLFIAVTSPLALIPIALKSIKGRGSYE